MRKSMLTALVLWISTGPLAADEHILRVSTDFPGGAAKVVEVHQTRRAIRFEPPEFRQGGLRGWWYFRLEGIKPGETITLELLTGSARAKRAVYSLDQRMWNFTAPADRPEDESPSVYRQQVDAKSAWFAWYIPYLPENAQALVERVSGSSPHAVAFELCRSERDRPVWGVRVTKDASKPVEKQATPRAAVWIQARQHAWEVGGSWTAHGLVEWLVSDDSRAVALRERAEVFVIPIMDVDSVQQGAGGKWQDPHDHNRDWSDKPHWRAVQAAILQCQRLDQADRLALFLDLHDPSWTGTFEFWCNPYPVMRGLRRERTDQFLRACKAEITGVLPFDDQVYSPYTIDTPTAGNWSSQKTRETVVGGTCEIGVSPGPEYAGKPPEAQLVAGRQLGLAIERYLGSRK